LTSPQNVYPIEKIRNAAIAAKQILDRFVIEREEKRMRQDIFELAELYFSKAMNTDITNIEILQRRAGWLL
jgi:hypothetical protein